MICKNCAEASEVEAASDLARNTARALHAMCTGPGQCDCQHRVRGEDGVTIPQPVDGVIEHLRPKIRD